MLIRAFMAHSLPDRQSDSCYPSVCHSATVTPKKELSPECKNGIVGASGCVNDAESWKNLVEMLALSEPHMGQSSINPEAKLAEIQDLTTGYTGPLATEPKAVSDAPFLPTHSSMTWNV